MCDVADELDNEDDSEETGNKGKDNQNKKSEAKYAPLAEPKKAQKTQKVGINATSGESDKYYEMDRLLKVKFMQGKKHYLVKWKGQYKNTWEHENYITEKPKENSTPIGPTKGEREEKVKSISNK